MTLSVVRIKEEKKMLKNVVRVLTSTLLGAAVLCAAGVSLVGGCSEKCDSCSRHTEKPCDTCSH